MCCLQFLAYPWKAHQNKLCPTLRALSVFTGVFTWQCPYGNRNITDSLWSHAEHCVPLHLPNFRASLPLRAGLTVASLWNIIGKCLCYPCHAALSSGTCWILCLVCPVLMFHIRGKHSLSPLQSTSLPGKVKVASVKIASASQKV